MKKFITLIIIIFFTKFLFAQETTSSQSSGRLLLGSGSLAVSGYKDAISNDGAYYSGSSVGATFVEFSSTNKTTSVSQVNLGRSYKYTLEHYIDFDDIGGTSGETTATILTLGYTYNLDLSNIINNFYIQPSIAYGTATVSSNLGTVEEYGTMPVIITDGTFNEGAEIRSEATGFSNQIWS